MDKQYIIKAFFENNIELTDKQAEQFKIYCDFLLQYNEKVNLTAVTDEKEVIEKHFIDSVKGAFLIKENSLCADIGTGAGFPGVPLAIMRPDIKVCLVDALNKRLVFLNELKEKLNLDNVYTVHGRSEDLGKTDMRQKFDYVFSRAVARLNILAEYDLPFVKKGGYMLAWKGPQIFDEIKESETALKILGGETPEIHTADMDEKEHYIAVVKKIKDTPQKYPRQAGKPTKSPL